MCSLKIYATLPIYIAFSCQGACIILIAVPCLHLAFLSKERKPVWGQISSLQLFQKIENPL